MDEMRALRDAAFDDMPDWRLARRIYFWGRIPRYVFSADVGFLQAAYDARFNMSLLKIAEALRHVYSAERTGGTGIADEAPHRILMVRAALEDPRRQRTGDARDVMQCSRIAFTSKPWGDLAMKWYREDTAMLRSEIVSAALTGPLTNKLKGGIFENNVKALLSVKGTHKFRIRRLGVADAVDEEVSGIGGALLGGLNWKRGCRLGVSGFGGGCGPQVPACDQMSGVDKVCCLTCDKRGWWGIGVFGHYWSSNYNPGAAYAIHMGGLQKAAAAVGWYDKYDRNELLDHAIGLSLAAYRDTKRSAADRRAANAVIRDEFTRMKDAGVAVDPQYSLVEAAINVEWEAILAGGKTGRKLNSADISLQDATAAVGVALSRFHSAVQLGSASPVADAAAVVTVPAMSPTPGVPHVRPPVPFVFLLEPARYAEKAWRRRQILNGNAAGHLNESVVQYAMEVDVRGLAALQDREAAGAEFVESADRWVINEAGDPVPPSEVTLPPELNPPPEDAPAPAALTPAAAPVPAVTPALSGLRKQ